MDETYKMRQIKRAYPYLRYGKVQWWSERGFLPRRWGPGEKARFTLNEVIHIGFLAELDLIGSFGPEIAVIFCLPQARKAVNLARYDAIIDFCRRRSHDVAAIISWKRTRIENRDVRVPWEVLTPIILIGPKREMDHVHWRWLMGQIDRVNSSISYINIKKLSEKVRSILTGEVRNENSNHNGSNARVDGASVRISARLDNKGPTGQDSMVRLHERGCDHQAGRNRQGDQY